MNKVIETMLNRGSLRTYSDERIKDEELDIILQCAMKAPTSASIMLAAEDAMCAAQNAVIAAESLGIGSYAQMHYCFKVKSDFSKEMQKSVDIALNEWNGHELNEEI